MEGIFDIHLGGPEPKGKVGPKPAIKPRTSELLPKQSGTTTKINKLEDAAVKGGGTYDDNGTAVRETVMITIKCLLISGAAGDIES